jgi:hypothetical protein
VTLPNDDVITFLDSRFILVHRNIQKDLHVGMSHGYTPSQSAVGTTNGAGPRNVQFLILAADETVLHALPGFWHAEDLIPELQLAFEINRLYLDEAKSESQKEQMYAMLHQAHMRRHGADANRRGQWQNFDRTYENSRVQREQRDTFRIDAAGQMTLKCPKSFTTACWRVASSGLRTLTWRRLSTTVVPTTTTTTASGVSPSPRLSVPMRSAPNNKQRIAKPLSEPLRARLPGTSNY